MTWRERFRRWRAWRQVRKTCRRSGHDEFEAASRKVPIGVQIGWSPEGAVVTTEPGRIVVYQCSRCGELRQEVEKI